MAWASLNRIVTAMAGLAFCLAVASDAAACPICIGFPKNTDADYLLNAQCVVLARPQQLDPFQYAAHEVLKGEYDGSKFDLLVDSATRRMLDAHQDRHVLLAQATQHGPWQHLGTTTPEFESIVRRLITIGVTWDGDNSAIERSQFFVRLFGHSEERIRNLAYLELGRAPYSMIRPLGRTISRDSLAPFLDNRQYTEWQGLAILLLAQSESDVDRKRILQSFQDCMQYGLVTNLSAWTAAAVEVDPMGSLQQIETNYFANVERTKEELDAVFLAITMLGAQEGLGLRERIIASYEVLLHQRPQFAPRVAQYLSAWKRTELSEQLTAISLQQRDFDFDQTLSIQRYVRGVAMASKLGPGDE